MSKNILEASLEGAEHIVLLGHIHPDGDCIGTTLGSCLTICGRIIRR
ncbi:MAG: hypothetical protein ACLR8P_17775 [Clostridium fessum]